MFWNKKQPASSKTIVITDDNFEELVLRSDQAILLDFWAPWCGPCKVLNPIIEELAEDFDGRAIIGKVNVDQNPGLSQKFKVKSIPTILLIKYSNLYERINGMVPKPNLSELIEELIEIEPPVPSE
jgi:thioredoxin 1